ncbi:TetR/AcrR family transcriptional regulator [Aquamicrobium sp. LC103]|uniref:TetR/AcrR family transcriptional regulator n=1 Tax=Aquamicrobium sp. LC103 TaxID=1120658 RepID=UPI00063E8E30|nr:TetR/AcrR family transcriptional regulator [Aquamicrobium sp. LC103]TKT75234.1 TetR/AcrR family transcriptional regulator [Aquamicrobium sp. LC103]
MTTEEETRRSIGAKRNPKSAEAIREAAEGLLLEEGYRGFSIEAVARRARAGKPTIYRWWPSKAALLLDVYHRQKRDVESPDTGSLEEDLLRFLRSLFRNWRETPAGNVFRSFIAEAQTDDTAAAALADYARERRIHTARMISRARERGEVGAEVDPEVVADLVASYAWSHLLTGRLDEGDDALRAAIGIIVNGAARRPVPE